MWLRVPFSGSFGVVSEQSPSPPPFFSRLFPLRGSVLTGCFSGLRTATRCPGCGSSVCVCVLSLSYQAVGAAARNFSFESTWQSGGNGAACVVESEAGDAVIVSDTDEVCGEGQISRLRICIGRILNHFDLRLFFFFS